MPARYVACSVKPIPMFNVKRLQSPRGVTSMVAVGTVATVDTGPGGRTAYVPLSAIVSVTRPG